MKKAVVIPVIKRKKIRVFIEAIIITLVMIVILIMIVTAIKKCY